MFNKSIREIVYNEPKKNLAGVLNEVEIQIVLYRNSQKKKQFAKIRKDALYLSA